MKEFLTEQIKADYLKSLKTLVSYPSVLNEGENGTPFGQSIQNVLEKMLEITRSLGFKTCSEQLLKAVLDTEMWLGCCWFFFFFSNF